ncbi:unnamed protein product [Victoria cruziana]
MGGRPSCRRARARVGSEEGEHAPARWSEVGECEALCSILRHGGLLRCGPSLQRPTPAAVSFGMGSSTAGSSSMAVLCRGHLWHDAPPPRAPPAWRSSATASSGTASVATSSSGTALPYNTLLFSGYVLWHINFLRFPFLRLSPPVHLSCNEKGTHRFSHKVEAGRRAAPNEGFSWNKRGFCTREFSVEGFTAWSATAKEEAMGCNGMDMEDALYNKHWHAWPSSYHFLLGKKIFYSLQCLQRQGHATRKKVSGMCQMLVNTIKERKVLSLYSIALLLED